MTVVATNRKPTLAVEKTPGATVTEADLRRALLNLLGGAGNTEEGAGGGSSAPSPESVSQALQTLERKLDSLQGTVKELAEALGRPEPPPKGSYTTAEVAEILGLRPLTVREWCRLGRINARKTHAGRGEDREWRITHEELVRYQNEGLLPLQYTRSGRRVK